MARNKKRSVNKKKSVNKSIKSSNGIRRARRAFRMVLLYIIIHIVICIFSIYLSYKCNGNTFQFLPTIGSIFFPYIYVLYALIFNFQCIRGVFTGSEIKV